MATQVFDPVKAAANVAKELERLTQEPESFVECSRRQAVGMLEDLERQASPEFFKVVVLRRQHKESFPVERVMVGCFNVTKYEIDRPRRYDPADYGLFWVCDMQALKDFLLGETAKAPYRSINCEGILSLRIKGVEYKVTSEGVDTVSDKR